MMAILVADHDERAVPTRDGLLVSALTKRYGTKRALDGVDLSVPPGRVHGLVGPNGAGKSTLLAILLGLVSADSGTVDWCGGGTTQTRAIPGGVAGTVEQPRSYPQLTAREHLSVLRRMDGAAAMPVDEALALVGLQRERDTRTGRLSLGMRQRLAIAGALLRRPGLLILDEPTSGLDPQRAVELLDLIRGLAAAQTSVLLSSHDLGMVGDVCHDVTVLVRGRVVCSGKMADLRKRAPHGSIRISTSEDARALPMLCSVPGIELVISGPTGMVVRAEQRVLDAAARLLAVNGISIRRLVEERTPLQALYASLTDESEEAA